MKSKSRQLKRDRLKKHYIYKIKVKLKPEEKSSGLIYLIFSSSFAIFLPKCLR